MMRPIFVAAIVASICSYINAATNVCAVMQKWGFLHIANCADSYPFQQKLFHGICSSVSTGWQPCVHCTFIDCANVKRAHFLHTLILLYEIRNPTLTQIDFMRIISFVCLFVCRTREMNEASANQLTENDNSMNIAIFNETLVSFPSPTAPVCQTWP